MAYGTKHQTVDGVKLIGSNLFGTCSTSPGTSQKTVSLDGFDVLVTGVTIHVKFDYYNSASYPSLKVGTTTAQSIRRNGSSYGQWESGAVVSFTYDGTYWQQNDFYDTSYYVDTKYTLSGSGETITLTGSDNTSSSATVPNYTIARDGRTLTLQKRVGNSGSWTNVQSRTMPKVITRTIQRTLSLTKGSYESKQWTPDPESGYTPIGLVGFSISGSYSYQVNVWSAYFDSDNKVYMQIYNPSSSHDVSLTITMRVLYAPN